MQYALDAIIILIPVICIFLGYRRGFVRTILQLVGTIAAFVVAMMLSSTVSPIVFDSFVSEPLQETVVKTLQESDTSTIEAQVQTALDELPDVLVDLIHADEMAQTALEQLKTQLDDSAPAVAETLVVNVIRPLAVSLIHFLLFILLFIVLSFVVKLIIVAVKPVTKLPLIHQVDQFLGGGVGLLKGAIFALVAVTAMQLFLPEWLEQTTIAAWLSANNPVAGIL